MKAYKAVMKGGLQGVSFDTDSNGEGIVNWELKEGDEILVRENKSTCSGVKMYRVLDRPEVGYIPKTAIHIIGEAKYEPTPLPPPEPYEMVNHPSHYNNYSVEFIDMMERVYGTLFKEKIQWERERSAMRAKIEEQLAEIIRLKKYGVEHLLSEIDAQTRRECRRESLYKELNRDNTALRRKNKELTIKNKQLASELFKQKQNYESSL